MALTIQQKIDSIVVAVCMFALREVLESDIEIDRISRMLPNGGEDIFVDIDKHASHFDMITRRRSTTLAILEFIEQSIDSTNGDTRALAIRATELIYEMIIGD